MILSSSAIFSSSSSTIVSTETSAVGEADVIDEVEDAAAAKVAVGVVVDNVDGLTSVTRSFIGGGDASL